MDITIAICTWNRADLLEKTLEQMRVLNIPAGVSWEVLVVDNCCTDHTQEVIASFNNVLPLHCLTEAKAGKSYALNTAIDQIKSDLILWTDDDVLVDPNWLAAYVDAADKNPQAGFFGGPISPWFESQPPAWLEACWPRLAIAYAVRHCDDGLAKIDRDTPPFGANFAIRTDVQRQYLYNTALGRVGAGQRRGEETELVERMLDDGVEGLWIPDALVQHFIPTSRLGEPYIRGFYYGIGQTDAVLEQDPENAAARTRRGPTHAFAKAVFAELRFQCTRRVCKPNQWVKDLTKCSYYWGRRAG